MCTVEAFAQMNRFGFADSCQGAKALASVKASVAVGCVVKKPSYPGVLLKTPAINLLRGSDLRAVIRAELFVRGLQRVSADLQPHRQC